MEDETKPKTECQIRLFKEYATMEKEGKILVSVLLPVYNVENYLKKCLNSIINQNYKNLEIIIIDDGSTDHSLEIIKKYAKQDHRIRYYSRENRGLLKTRIEELKLCVGDYIAFIDSDDWVDADYIEKLVYAAEVHGADVVRCGDVIEFVKEGRRRVFGKSCKDPIIIKDDFFDQMVEEFYMTSLYNSVHSEIIRSSIITKNLFDELWINHDVEIGEDIVFNSALYAKTQKIVCIPNKMYHYRKNPNSIMMKNNQSSLDKRLKDIITVLNCIRKYADSKGVKKEKYYQDRLYGDIDNCINDYFKSKVSCNDRRYVICKAKKIIAKNGLDRNIPEKYGYLREDRNNMNIIIFKKYLTVSITYRLKQMIKSILILKKIIRKYNY